MANGGLLLCSPVQRGNAGKSSEPDTPTNNHWLELIDEHNEPVNLNEIKRARVDKVFRIIYCTNNKDISDDANWAQTV